MGKGGPSRLRSCRAGVPPLPTQSNRATPDRVGKTAGHASSEDEAVAGDVAYPMKSNSLTLPALSHGSLRCRRPVAFERGAAHVAHLARVAVAPGAMHSLAVIPHHEIVLTPGMSVDELPLSCMLDEVAHEGERLGHRPADNAADMRRQEERLAACCRIGPHQPMAHRRELHPLFGGEIREAKLSAGEQQRVLGDQIF